jgi:curli biogenesis system outer membrane secretion channel CsgG
LFDWQALSTNSLVKSPEKRSEARKILLCEYFVSGAVTQYNVALKSEVSAFSKRKTYTTNVRVDLVLQDAATGEYLAAAVGKGDNKQEFSGGAGGGQTGSWDPASGDAALDAAIQDALKTLVKSYRDLQEDA